MIQNKDNQILYSRNTNFTTHIKINDKLFTGGGEKQAGKKQRGNLRKAFTFFFVTPLRPDQVCTKMKGIQGSFFGKFQCSNFIALE